MKTTIKMSLVMLAFTSLSAHSQTTKIEAIHYQTGKRIVVEIEGELITRIEPTRKAFPGQLFVAPGLIDLQVNGCNNVDFSDQNLSSDDLLKATQALWGKGVTSFLPTVNTASRENLLKSFELLAKVSSNPEVSASIPGFHLEGPYISPEKGFRGTHPEKYVRQPDWDEFSALQEAASGKIKLITLAPEAEGAIPLIQMCKSSGVIVSLGHHNGKAGQIEKAADAGASLSTHLGNGSARLIDRHNNPIWPQLADDRLSISIIADGVHLNKYEVRTFCAAKGINRTILISDASGLANATSSLSACITNIIKFTSCTLGEAIQMASANPAKLMGWNKLGELAVGKRADIMLFTIENGKLVIQKTIVAGKVVFEK